MKGNESLARQDGFDLIADTTGDAKKALYSLCFMTPWRAERARKKSAQKGFVFHMFIAFLARGARRESFSPEMLCFPYVFSIPGARSAADFLAQKGFVFLIFLAYPARGARRIFSSPKCFVFLMF